jgi:hypothetical protein
MTKKKAHFTKLTITLTYYGVGKTLKDAKLNAINEFVNDHTELYNSNDFKQNIEEVKKEDTSLDNYFIDFVMENDYEEHDAREFLKGGKDNE